MHATFHVLTCTASVLLLLSVTPYGSAADEQLPEIRIENVPLSDVVANLARQTGMNFILDPRMPGSTFGAGRHTSNPAVTVRWTNMSAHSALTKLFADHKLTIITNPATTVARIAPAGVNINPIPVSQALTNGKAFPRVVMDFVPLTQAITGLGQGAGLKIVFDPQITWQAIDNQGTVSFSWRDITPRQALAALLDNYGLTMIEDSATSTARITIADAKSKGSPQ